MRSFIFAACIVAIAGCSTTSLQRVDAPTKLTRANYEAVQEGMTRPQVVNILEEPTNCGDQSGDQLSIEVCVWGIETNGLVEPFVSVFFENGKVYKKRMGNLK